jgi:hypothetical protein
METQQCEHKLGFVILHKFGSKVIAKGNKSI